MRAQVTSIDRPLKPDEIRLYRQMKSHVLAVHNSFETLGRDLHNPLTCEICSHEIIGQYAKVRLQQLQRYAHKTLEQNI